MYTIEEFDKEKSKVMNYIMYKKRTEYEVRNKFNKAIEENLLNDIIEYVKEAGYLNDSNYIERAINEFINLKHISIKEIKYKLLSKGINVDLIDEYIYNNRDELNEYEIASIRHILYKNRSTKDIEEIQNYLIKRGFKKDNIKIVIEEEE